jgi:hypothetical protein
MQHGRDRHVEPADYRVTSEGQVVVNVRKLAASPEARRLAELAAEIVRLTNKNRP